MTFWLKGLGINMSSNFKVLKEAVLRNASLASPRLMRPQGSDGDH